MRRTWFELKRRPKSERASLLWTCAILEAIVGLVTSRIFDVMTFMIAFTSFTVALLVFGYVTVDLPRRERERKGSESLDKAG